MAANEPLLAERRSLRSSRVPAFYAALLGFGCMALYTGQGVGRIELISSKAGGGSDNIYAETGVVEYINSHTHIHEHARIQTRVLHKPPFVHIYAYTRTYSVTSCVLCQAPDAPEAPCVYMHAYTRTYSVTNCVVCQAPDTPKRPKVQHALHLHNKPNAMTAEEYEARLGRDIHGKPLPKIKKADAVEQTDAEAGVAMRQTKANRAEVRTSFRSSCAADIVPTGKYKYRQTHASTHRHTARQTHMNSHIYSDTHTRTHTHTHKHTHRKMHTHTHPYTHTRTRTHTTNANTQTNEHPHLHTHAYTGTGSRMAEEV